MWRELEVEAQAASTRRAIARLIGLLTTSRDYPHFYLPPEKEAAAVPRSV
jgi:hypothetical protein